jgi:hypothetical protein
MKKTITTIVVAASIVLIGTKAYQFSSDPMLGMTGAPGENDCSLCHANTVNSGTGKVEITFNNGSNSYESGKTYPVTVKVTQSGISKFGFEITSVVSSSTSTGAGTFASTTADVGVASQSGKSYANQLVSATTSGSGTFTFNWTAPATSQGDITFYAAGNAANGNRNSTGDNIYTSSLTVTPLTTFFQDSKIDNEVVCFTNQKTLYLFKQYMLGKTTLTLYSPTGTLVKQMELDAEQTEIPCNELASGLYILKLKNQSASYTKTILFD